MIIEAQGNIKWWKISAGRFSAVSETSIALSVEGHWRRKIWAERLLLMRVETLKARKTEENKRLWKREEEAREQEEEAREQEEEAREQLRKRKESPMSSYLEVIQESLLQRNRVRDRLLPAEQLRAYLERGQWGCVLPRQVSMCIL
jgi:DNA anti-recombination protein RmuC